MIIIFCIYTGEFCSIQPFFFYMDEEGVCCCIHNSYPLKTELAHGVGSSHALVEHAKSQTSISNSQDERFNSASYH